MVLVLEFLHHTFVFWVGGQQTEQKEGRLGPDFLVFRLHTPHQDREPVVSDERLQSSLLLSDQTYSEDREQI